MNEIEFDKFKDFIFPFVAKLLKAVPVQLDQKKMYCILCNQSSPLRKFIESIILQAESFQKECKKNFPNGVLKVLSAELHFQGTHVLRTTSKISSTDYVIYSNKRANSPLFFHLCSWLSELMNIPLFSRYPSKKISALLQVRPYIESQSIKDEKKVSFYSGILLALCQFVGMTDIHNENIIFNNDSPIILDDECICQPTRMNQIKALNNSSKFYPLSPFRSLLLPGISEDQNNPSIPFKEDKKCGFLSLFLQEKLNVHSLVDGYLQGFDLIKRSQKEILEIFYSVAQTNPNVRYLTRSTQFYSILKELVSLQLFFHRNCHFKKLENAFDFEKKMFPELNSCIPQEIESILSGNTPYWQLNIMTGKLFSSNVDKKHMIFEKTPLEFLQEHLHSVSISSAKKITDNIKTAVNVLMNKLQDSAVT